MRHHFSYFIIAISRRRRNDIPVVSAKAVLPRLGGLLGAQVIFRQPVGVSQRTGETVQLERLIVIRLNCGGEIIPVYAINGRIIIGR
jgi:hypothetical protein